MRNKNCEFEHDWEEVESENSALYIILYAKNFIDDASEEKTDENKKFIRDYINENFVRPMLRKYHGIKYNKVCLLCNTVITELEDMKYDLEKTILGVLKNIDSLVEKYSNDKENKIKEKAERKKQAKKIWDKRI